MKSILRTLIYVYLFWSNIYWIPKVGPGPVRAVQYGQIGLILAIWVFIKLRERKVSGLLGNWSLIFLGFLLLSIPGLLQSSTIEASVNYSINIFQAFLFSIVVIDTFSTMDVKLPVHTSFFRVCILFTLFWLGNLALFTFEPSSVDGSEFWMVGFDWKNNKWSISLAFVFTVVWSYFIHSKVRHWKLASLLALILLAVGMLFTTGRAGLLAIFIIVLRDIKLTVKTIAVASLSLAVLIYAGLTYVYTYTDIDMEQWLKLILNSGDLSSFDSDDFSGGRARQFSYAMEVFGDSPFTGVGVDSIQEMMDKKFGNYWNIHNLILRLTVESGVLLGAYVSFIMLIILRSLKKMSASKETNHMTTSVILVALIVSMFEPNMIVGTFQFSAFWWFAIGIFYLNINKYQYG